MHLVMFANPSMQQRSTQFTFSAICTARSDNMPLAIDS
jgi:hypothetical protein